MRGLVVRYLRFAGVSVCLLAMGACAKLAPSDLNAHRPEPRFDEPPVVQKTDETLALSAQEAALEADLAMLAAAAADLRLALDVMGPLPDPAAGLVQATWPEAAKSPGHRTIYRPTPSSAVKVAEFALPFPVTADTRLVVSSLPGEGARDALCVELAALAGRCRPTAPVRAYR